MPVVRHASEIKPGDVILGRRAGPLVVTRQPFESLYRGVQPGWRIPVEGLTGMTYPAIRTPGNPKIYVAQDPDDAWNEHAMAEKMPRLNA